jgi:hypothetical protein
VTQTGGSGNDLIGEFQRWLLRFGARGMSREVGDQIRAALGRNQATGDVWGTATADPAPAEAPECAWCPLCRAARLVREAKPGRDTNVAAVGDALATVVQDAVSVLDAALAATGRGAAGNGRQSGPARRPATGQAASAGPAPARGGDGAVVAPGPGDQAAPEPPGESPREPDDRG